MMAPAAVAWGAHLGWLHFGGTKLAFIGSIITLIIFTLFAIGELIGDKLPKTPARTSPPGLITRVIFGSACAAALAVGSGAHVGLASVAGVIGALVGTYGGYAVRHALTANGKLKDLPVALVEDVIAIAVAFLVVSHLVPGA